MKTRNYDFWCVYHLDDDGRTTPITVFAARSMQRAKGKFLEVRRGRKSWDYYRNKGYRIYKVKRLKEQND